MYVDNEMILLHDLSWGFLGKMFLRIVVLLLFPNTDMFMIDNELVSLVAVSFRQA